MKTNISAMQKLNLIESEVAVIFFSKQNVTGINVTLNENKYTQYGFIRNTFIRNN